MSSTGKYGYFFCSKRIEYYEFPRYLGVELPPDPSLANQTVIALLCHCGHCVLLMVTSASRRKQKKVYSDPSYLLSYVKTVK